MKVSVIIPAYNEEKYIKKCLKSINNQTLRREEYEVIVCDDASTDKTSTIAKKYADKLIRLKKCKTIGEVRNKGAKKAKGEILLFVDADTKLKSDFLQKILECKTTFGISKNLYYGDEDFISLLNILNNFFLKNIPRLAVTPGCCMYINKKEFNRIGGFNKDYKRNEDNLFFQKLFKQKKKISLVDSKVYTSDRKLKQKGRLKFATEHLISYLKYLLGIRDDFYEPIR